MSLRRSASALVAVVAGVFVAASAQAAVMLATYTGTVHQGYDEAGIFGAKGADLAGLSFTSSFRYDTGIGQSSEDPTSQSLAGGYDFGLPSGALGASIRINGVTFQILPDRAMIVDIRVIDGGTGYFHTFMGGETLIQTGLFGLADFPSLTAPIHAVSAAPVNGSGVFSAVPSPTPGDPSTVLSLATQTLTVSVVPEPATWAMMIIGFGAVGSMIRSSRRWNAFSAASRQKNRMELAHSLHRGAFAVLRLSSCPPGCPRRSVNAQGFETGFHRAVSCQ